MSSKKKILFFLQAAVGGAERVSVIIAKSFDLKYYDVSFILVGDKHGAKEIQEFIPQHYTCTLIPKLHSGIAQIRLYSSVIKQASPNYVFSSVFHINTKLLSISLFFPNTKFIVRNNIGLYRLSFLKKIIVGISYALAHTIICQTEEMENELNKMFPFTKGRTIILHNPLDKEFINARKDEGDPICQEKRKPVFIASGRYSKEKGFDILLKAFNKVLVQYPEASLYILGNKTGNNAPYANLLVELANELHIEDKVVFFGYTSNPYSMVAHANCYVQSSYAEGLPNALIEALYLGTPAAATTCIPIVKRIIQEGMTGYLAPVGDADRLADAMIKALQLGRIKTTYQPEDLDQFRKLFESTKHDK